MIAVLFGTRPEFIKLAPILRRLIEKRLHYILIHSGQHYSYKLNNQITIDLKLPKPDFNLKVGSGSHAEQTGKIMVGMEQILLKQKPKLLIVHGDTNTMLAGSLAAKKLHIAVVHVEAGLRSFDQRMPEEINRVITDKISDLLFAPTEGTKQNLLKDGIAEEKIFVTGNTIVDALIEYLPLSKKSSIWKRLKLKKDNYILVTAHRVENVDDAEHLNRLISLLNYAAHLLNKKIIWPIHPRTKSQLIINKINLGNNIEIIPPTNYVDMLSLIKYASLIMTDSGGIQEESYLLKRPVVTLRSSTERPETLTANFLVELDKDKLKKAYNAFQKRQVYWVKDVFGKGNAGELIVKHLRDFLDRKLKIDEK